MQELKIVQVNNMTFASVHDSYWTHAADVPKMAQIIRETFIALHSSDVLDKLDEEVGHALSTNRST